MLLQKLQQHMLHLLAGRCRGGHAGAGARGPGRLSQLERLWARRREGREARRALQTTRTRQPYTHTYVERHGAQCDYQGEDTAAMDPPAEGAAERRQTRAMSRRLALAEQKQAAEALPRGRRMWTPLTARRLRHLMSEEEMARRARAPLVPIPAASRRRQREGSDVIRVHVQYVL